MYGQLLIIKGFSPFKA